MLAFYRFARGLLRGRKTEGERGVFTEESSQRKQRKTEGKLCERERAKPREKRGRRGLFGQVKRRLKKPSKV